MFSPQKKRGWLPSPRSVQGPNPRNGNWKGKGVAAVAEALHPPTPPSPMSKSLLGGESSEAEAWKRFRDAGLLDESVLRRKEREALAERIAYLEKELYDYQYTMGLLLIEKEEWASEREDIRHGLAEADEILQQEQVAHLIAVSDLEKREEILRKDLVVEKQHVRQLQRLLYEMRAEISDVKLTSGQKLAHALESSIQEKHLEINDKLHQEDAKPAEVIEKCIGIHAQLEEVDGYGCNSLGKIGHEKDLSWKRENMQSWDHKLTEEKTLGEGHHLYDEGENGTSASNSIPRKKGLLEEEVDDARIRPEGLFAKEKELETKQMNLEKKERVLLAIEEKLAATGRVEFQGLSDDHKILFHSNLEGIEELVTKSISCNKDQNAVEKKESKNRRREDLISEREQALYTALEKLEHRKKEFDINLRDLEKREESIHKDEKTLKDGNEKLAIDAHKLDNEIDEYRIMKESLGKEYEDLRKERLKLDKEQEKLVEGRMLLEKEAQETREREKKVLKKEQEFYGKVEELKQKEKELDIKSRDLEKREESIHKCENMLKVDNDQLAVDTHKLETEMDNCRIMKEFLAKQTEDLRQERHKLEKEQEVLAEGRMTLEAEIKQLNDDKEGFKRWQQLEEERLRHERLKIGINTPQPLDDLRSDTEASMVNENLNTVEVVSMMQEKIEENLRKKEGQLVRKKIEIDNNLRSKLKVDGNRNADDQQEELIEGEECFPALAENWKVCKNRGAIISEVNLFDPQSRSGMLVGGDVLLEENMKGDHVSWLQKCSMLFHLSPGERAHLNQGQASKSTFYDREASKAETETKPEQFFEVRDNNSSDNQMAQCDSGDGNNVISEMKVSQHGYNVSSIDGKSESRHPGGRRGKDSVEVILEDARTIRAELLEEKEEQLDGITKDLVDIKEEIPGNAVPGDQMEATAGQKRHFGGTSGSSVGGHPKRQQMYAPVMLPPGEGRYNFRRSTIEATAAVAQALANRKKGSKRGCRSTKVHESMTPKSIPGGGGDETAIHRSTDASFATIS